MRTAPRDEERRPGDPRLPRRANDGAGAMISPTVAPDELLQVRVPPSKLSPANGRFQPQELTLQSEFPPTPREPNTAARVCVAAQGEGRPLRTSNEYQQQAIRCLGLAQTVDYPPSKAVLLDLAEQWAKTARQARDREAERSPSIHPTPHPEG
jgi:hypothetical protein